MDIANGQCYCDLEMLQKYKILNGCISKATRKFKYSKTDKKPEDSRDFHITEANIYRAL
jgi:predicted  nucleic acid-binding Zn-ribbon protein